MPDADDETGATAAVSPNRPESTEAVSGDTVCDGRKELPVCCGAAGNVVRKCAPADGRGNASRRPVALVRSTTSWCTDMGAATGCGRSFAFWRVSGRQSAMLSQPE